MAQFGVKTRATHDHPLCQREVGNLPTVAATGSGIAFSITGVGNIIAAPFLGGRGDRGAAFGITSSATFLGNSIGPLLGGVIAAGFGLSWLFVMAGVVMAVNFAWVYRRVPEHGAGRAVQA
jgi:MFS family permease